MLLGWRKVLAYSSGGELALGNWRARYNLRDSGIDLVYPSDGIPYVKNDTVFAGSHYYTEVNAGKLQIEQWPGWDDTTTVRDETYILDDATTWDDVLNYGDVVINYLFGATSVMQSYEGGASFEAGEVSLNTVGEYNSSLIDWVVTQPTGTTLNFQTSVFNGASWSAWANEVKATSIENMPASGKDLFGYKVKYRVTMQTNSLGETPAISSVNLTFNSVKHFRVLGTGVYKESQYIKNNAVLATETL